MVIFVHMASVWVPFTSESKEAIAEYDEIGKEITLALRECGRRLGAFLRRRERAHSEQSRRNIFELYIEEVVESCNRLKGGRLPVAKLKEQLQKMAMKRTGGEKTDEVLGKNGHAPEGLPHSIIVTADGVEGEVPTVIAPPVTVAPANGNGHPAAEEKNEKESPSGREGRRTRRPTRGGQAPCTRRPRAQAAEGSRSRQTEGARGAQEGVGHGDGHESPEDQRSREEARGRGRRRHRRGAAAPVIPPWRSRSARSPTSPSTSARA